MKLEFVKKYFSTLVQWFVSQTVRARFMSS